MKKLYLEKVKKLYLLDKEGLIPKLEKHEVHPNLEKSSRESYLYFFLSCALNFQRRSPALWQSAFNTWMDHETRYVFFPEQVMEMSFEKLQRDLVKHRLALQKNKHPKIWKALCTTLHKSYNDDPRELFKENDFLVEKIVHSLQIEKKKLFPYISGIKLSNYVLMVLSKFTDLKLKDFYNLSIIPDTHIRQATLQLGILEGTPTPRKVEEVWRGILKETGIAPHEMHSILWHWSRNHFLPRV